MADTRTPKGAAAPLLTSQESFHLTEAGHKTLFSVNAGIDACDALNGARCFVSSAMEVINDIANDQAEKMSGWAEFYLLENSLAVIDSVVQSLMNEKKKRMAT
jgi:hypothetical protein